MQAVSGPRPEPGRAGLIQWRQPLHLRAVEQQQRGLRCAGLVLGVRRREQAPDAVIRVPGQRRRAFQERGGGRDSASLPGLHGRALERVGDARVELDRR